MGLRITIFICIFIVEKYQRRRCAVLRFEYANPTNYVEEPDVST